MPNGYTIVTAQVIDPAGQLYANATYSVSLVNLNTTPGAKPPNLSNSPFQTQIVGARCDSSGRLVVELADNLLISPGPTQWLFCISSVPYDNPEAIYSFEWQGVITGATIDITSALHAVAALLPMTGGVSGPIPINFLRPALDVNFINNTIFQQAWFWQLDGANPEDGLFIGEVQGGPSTNTGLFSAILAASTTIGSTVAPFRALAHDDPTHTGPGLEVNPAGDVQAINGATFIGPVRLPNQPNLTVLGTDAIGNITKGVPGIQSINNDTTAAQRLVAGPGIVITQAPNGVTIIAVSGAASTLGSLSISPSSVLSGGTATGTVTLVGPAPAGGAVVTLNSDTPTVASVPGTVTVPTGQTTATFPVTAGTVTTTQTATITGTYGVSQSATLTVSTSIGVFGGVGQPGATGSVTLSGNTIILSTGDVLPQLQATPEQVGQSWQFAPTNQVIYLLLTGGARSFVDENGFSFPFNAPISTTIGGTTMYLYQSLNVLFVQPGKFFTVKVQS